MMLLLLLPVHFVAQASVASVISICQVNQNLHLASAAGWVADAAFACVPAARITRFLPELYHQAYRPLRVRD